MMALVGHQRIRATLASHQGSFALLGPSGVGKRLIADEWIARQSEKVTVLDLSKVYDCTPYLRPLEEGRETFVILSLGLPAAVRSRVPVFNVGYLTDSEVMQVLAKSYPKVANRSLVARLAGGTLEDIDVMVKAAETFDSFEKALEARHCPNLRANDPIALASCVRSACASVLGGTTLSISPEAKATIPTKWAKHFLSMSSPKSPSDARNQVVFFFSGLK